MIPFASEKLGHTFLISLLNSAARTFDFDGHYFAIGCGQPTNQLFGPSHGLRRLSATFNLDRAFVSLHTNRIRLIAFSPFDPSLILTGNFLSFFNNRQLSSLITNR